MKEEFAASWQRIREHRFARVAFLTACVFLVLGLFVFSVNTTTTSTRPKKRFDSSSFAAVASNPGSSRSSSSSSSLSAGGRSSSNSKNSAAFVRQRPFDPTSNVTLPDLLARMTRNLVEASTATSSEGTLRISGSFSAQSKGSRATLEDGTPLFRAVSECTAKERRLGGYYYDFSLKKCRRFDGFDSPPLDFEVSTEETTCSPDSVYESAVSSSNHQRWVKFGFRDKNFDVDRTLDRFNIDTSQLKRAQRVIDEYVAQLNANLTAPTSSVATSTAAPGSNSNSNNKPRLAPNLSVDYSRFMFFTSWLMRQWLPWKPLPVPLASFSQQRRYTANHDGGTENVYRIRNFCVSSSSGLYGYKPSYGPYRGGDDTRSHWHGEAQWPNYFSNVQQLSEPPLYFDRRPVFFMSAMPLSRSNMAHISIKLFSMIGMLDLPLWFVRAEDESTSTTRSQRQQKQEEDVENEFIPGTSTQHWNSGSGVKPLVIFVWAQQPSHINKYEKDTLKVTALAFYIRVLDLPIAVVTHQWQDQNYMRQLFERSEHTGEIKAEDKRLHEVAQRQKAENAKKDEARRLERAKNMAEEIRRNKEQAGLTFAPASTAAAQQQNGGMKEKRKARSDWKSSGAQQEQPQQGDAEQEPELTLPTGVSSPAGAAATAPISTDPPPVSYDGVRQFYTDTAGTLFCAARAVVWSACVANCIKNRGSDGVEEFAFLDYSPINTPRASSIAHYRALLANCLPLPSQESVDFANNPFALPKVFWIVRSNTRFISHLSATFDQIRRELDGFVSEIRMREPWRSSRAEFVREMRGSQILFGTHGGAMAESVNLGTDFFAINSRSQQQQSFAWSSPSVPPIRPVLIEFQLPVHACGGDANSAGCWFGFAADSVRASHWIYQLGAEPGKSQEMMIPAWQLTDAIRGAVCRFFHSNPSRKFPTKFLRLFCTSNKLVPSALRFKSKNFFQLTQPLAADVNEAQRLLEQQFGVVLTEKATSDLIVRLRSLKRQRGGSVFADYNLHLESDSPSLFLTLLHRFVDTSVSGIKLVTRATVLQVGVRSVSANGRMMPLEKAVCITVRPANAAVAVQPAAAQQVDAPAAEAAAMTPGTEQTCLFLAWLPKVK